jgi:hypothetical protein
MAHLWARVDSALRRLICRIFGHAKVDMSLRTVGLRVCRRCLVITEQKTVRARVARGEIEQRMRDYPPTGYSFVSCNWKKRKARFAKLSGITTLVSFLTH